jgi:glycosyltransferase involved in cell wall biosynthesis
MPMQPTVTVIVPLFNKADHIEKTLLSIAAQTHRDFEAIIVDDGSTDTSAHIASSFIAKTADQRFRIVSQPNAGPGAARNRGAALATGEYLAFLDADDQWGPRYLERSLSILHDTGPHIASVTSAYSTRPGDLSTLPMWRSRGLKDGLFRVTSKTTASDLAYSLAFMSPCSTVIRTSAFTRWGGFYEDRCFYGEDANLFLKILLNETVAFNLEPHVYINVDASGLAGGRVRLTATEPFLTNPKQVLEACPPSLEGLLREFLTIRALKRACILGYWGASRDARSMRRKFSSLRDWRLPYFVPAMLASAGFLYPIGLATRAINRRR